MNDINYPELKETILYELATSFIDLNIYGVKDQYPISSVFVYPNLYGYREDIFSAIEQNINTYHEVMLAQVLQLLSFRKFETPSDVYNLVLDELISRRKDPTLKESIDLTYLKELNLSEVTNFNSLKKYILWAEINTDIEYPIFRGFGFNVYTVNDLFYKEYNLPTGKFAYTCYMNEKPVYLMTGHNRKPGFLTNHRFYGTLPTQPKHPVFNDDADKIKYTVDKILFNLGIDKTIDKKDIILDIKDVKSIPEDISDEDKEKQIISTFSVLKKMCGI
jgi:hypothetical protein